MPGQEQKRPHEEQQPVVDPVKQESGGSGEDEEDEKDELEDFQIDDLLEDAKDISKHYKQKGGE